MADEALLAPVPADLLDDALASGMTRVAFGSMAWEFFRKLREDHGSGPLDVLLYASHADTFTLEVTWAGSYAGWRDAAEAERDPSFESELRSPLAHFDWAGNDEGGAWAVYWVVDDLHRLAEGIPVGTLRLPNGKKLSPAFIPHGPTRIRMPDVVLG